MEKERKKLRKEQIFKTPYSAYYVLYYLILIKRAFSQLAKMWLLHLYSTSYHINWLLAKMRR